MSRILWVSSETPDLVGKGGQRRQFHQIRSLLDRGHEITVLVPSSPQGSENLERLTTVERPQLTAWRRLSSGRVAAMRARIASPEWDAVIVSHVDSCWLLPTDGGTVAPVLVDLHNVMSRWFETLGLPDRAIDDAAREKEAIRVSTAVMTCSEEELRRLHGQHPETVGASFAAPLGVDPAEWPDVPFRRDAPIVAMFGTWDWHPNARGLEWFAAEVWPRVRTLVPDAVTLVAGSGAPETLPEGMTFVGRVDDLAAFGAAATVVAVPVLQGVGASVKFAESLATGASVIATPEGANAFGGSFAFVSDDPDAWAEWIRARLEGRFTEPAPSATRQRALTELTWAAAVESIDAWLRSLGDRGDSSSSAPAHPRRHDAEAASTSS